MRKYIDFRRPGYREASDRFSFWAKFFTQFSCRLIRRFITLLTPWPDPFRKFLSLCTSHGTPRARDFDSSAPCTLSSVVDNNRERRVTSRQFESITSAILGNVLVTPFKTTIEAKPWWHTHLWCRLSAVQYSWKWIDTTRCVDLDACILSTSLTYPSCLSFEQLQVFYVFMIFYVLLRNVPFTCAIVYVK